MSQFYIWYSGGVVHSVFARAVPSWAHSSKPAATGLLLWVRRARDIGRRSAAAASECGQCHVVAVRSKLDTNVHFVHLFRFISISSTCNVDYAGHAHHCIRCRNNRVKLENDIGPI